MGSVFNTLASHEFGRPGLWLLANRSSSLYASVHQSPSTYLRMSSCVDGPRCATCAYKSTGQLSLDSRAGAVALRPRHTVPQPGERQWHGIMCLHIFEKILPSSSGQDRSVRSNDRRARTVSSEAGHQKRR